MTFRVRVTAIAQRQIDEFDSRTVDVLSFWNAMRDPESIDL
jgi:hypothetical protein